MERPSMKENKGEKYKDYVILGIGEGGGYTSGYKDKTISRYNLIQQKIEQGATYLSIDKLDEKQEYSKKSLLTFLNKIVKIRNRNNKLKILRKYSKNTTKFKEKYSELNREFIRGDMAQLPLADNSINEIWLENVFSLVHKGRKIILGELFRALKKKGTIYIIEYYTPSDTKEYLEKYASENNDAHIEIFSGGDMLQKVLQLGLSVEEIQKIIEISTIAGERGIDNPENIFLAKVIKEK